MQFVLISTLHDPESRLYSLIEDKIVKLKSLFDNIIVCVTQKTGDNIINILQTNKIHVISYPGIKIIETYRKAIKKGLELAESNKKLFCIDFDRLLHWILEFPDELEEIITENCKSDFTIVGRTKRAFETHPTAMRETESIVNNLGSQLVNTNQNFDIISACWIFTKELASSLLKLKLESYTGFYCIWPLYLWKIAPTKAYIEVNGLEYETPDRFVQEIEANGYESWLNSIDTPIEWRRRVNIVRDCFNDLNKIGTLNLRSDFDSRKEPTPEHL